MGPKVGAISGFTRHLRDEELTTIHLLDLSRAQKLAVPKSPQSSIGQQHCTLDRSNWQANFVALICKCRHGRRVELQLRLHNLLKNTLIYIERACMCVSIYSIELYTYIYLRGLHNSTRTRYLEVNRACARPSLEKSIYEHSTLLVPR